MRDQIEIHPTEEGLWHFRDDGEDSPPFATRSEAIEAARAANEGRAIALLRLDGSLVGEIDHDRHGNADVQEVDLEPVNESGEVA